MTPCSSWKMAVTIIMMLSVGTNLGIKRTTYLKQCLTTCGFAVTTIQNYDAEFDGGGTWLGIVDDVFCIGSMLQRLTTKFDIIVWLTRVCLDNGLTSVNQTHPIGFGCIMYAHYATADIHSKFICLYPHYHHT